MKFAAKMFGVKRGPLSMRLTWEILPAPMLRFLLEIAEAEKARRDNCARPSERQEG
jgi:hypothetical protein